MPDEMTHRPVPDAAQNDQNPTRDSNQRDLSQRISAK